MYTSGQYLKGLRKPSLIWKEISEQIQRRVPHDVGVHGAYDTGNIGDRAIGKIFKNNLESQGYDTHLFSGQIEGSNSQMRVLGGGGVLHDWLGIDYLKNRLKYVTGSANSYILGVGVPGFQTNSARELVSKTFPQINLITVRDELSRQNIVEVSDVDVKVTADPAFLYEDPQVQPSVRTGVNFRPWFEEKETLSDSILKYHFGYEDLADAQDAYLRNVKMICRSLEDPVFIPFEPRDEDFARRHLDIPIMEYESSVETTLKRVSSVERMVTTRYHSLIFAAICRKPVLTLAYAPKVEQVAERLDIPYYKPHKEVPLSFSSVSNLSELRSKARNNFALLFDHIDEH